MVGVEGGERGLIGLGFRALGAYGFGPGLNVWNLSAVLLQVRTCVSVCVCVRLHLRVRAQVFENAHSLKEYCPYVVVTTQIVVKGRLAGWSTVMPHSSLKRSQDPKCRTERRYCQLSRRNVGACTIRKSLGVTIITIIMRRKPQE